MKITIDGKEADIKLENEKTIGEVLCGIEAWLAEGMLCISGITVDGNSFLDDSLAIFEKDIAGVQSMDIKTTDICSFYIESLLQAAEAVSDKNITNADWQKSAAANFLTEHDENLSKKILDAITTKENTAILKLITERLAELQNPAETLALMEADVNAVCGKLIDLPLDMQSGKDKRAAETIEEFSLVTEKLFRVINFYQYINPDSIKFSKNSTEFDEFNSGLKEFLASYENNDMILTGDLAEYELSPRLISIYNDIKNFIIPLKSHQSST